MHRLYCTLHLLGAEIVIPWIQNHAEVVDSLAANDKVGARSQLVGEWWR
jgi:hypothetical protein